MTKQNSTPMRLKDTHFLNIPAYANKVIEFAMNILNDKLKKRIIVSALTLSQSEYTN